MLYPLKFKPIIKDTIWGGSKIKNVFKKLGAGDICGESWEISAIQKDLSKVSNGLLKGNNLQELIEIYMGDLVGDSVYAKFGDEFPLLIKFIDASDDLSVQVHPDDETALKRHAAYGKNEMWYIIDADENARIINGFKKKTDQVELFRNLSENKITDILNFEKVKKDDVFFIPAGRIHSIGTGILLAEIQQTSDITYRLHDWNRKDKNGKSRDLHTDLAKDVIDYIIPETYRSDYLPLMNMTIKLVHCSYFNVNILHFDKIIEKNYNLIDSFIIYICIEGEFMLDYHTDKIRISSGETVLVPAILKGLYLIPESTSKILEVYIKAD